MTKRCPRCGLVKPASEYFANRSTADGISAWCKACNGAYNHETMLEPSLRDIGWNGTPPPQLGHFLQRLQFRQMQRLYGHPYGRHLTLDLLEGIWSAQGGRCAACFKPFFNPQSNGKPSVPHLDHDHRSGRIRGFLCSKCNQAAGLLWERLDILDRLHIYVQGHLPS